MRTELELAFSFLDVAEVTEMRKIARACVRNALFAARMASRFLAHAAQGDGGNGDISQRQDELLRRLREIDRPRTSTSAARASTSGG